MKEQNQNISYSRDKTGIALHDQKLSRKQWEKGYIDDATYFQTTTTNLKIFDLLFFKKMYPQCTEDQLKWLKNTGYDLISMESHHKCIQVSHIENGNVFFKYVSFTTSSKIIRLGFEKYTPIFLYEKEVNGEIKSIYIVPIVYECCMTRVEFKQYMNIENSNFVLSNEEKDKLNECIDELGKDFSFPNFNINKDFYELNLKTLDVNQKLTLTKFDFIAVEKLDSFKLPEE